MSYASLLIALQRAGLSYNAAGEVFAFLATNGGNYAQILAALQAMGATRDGGAERLSYDITSSQGYAELLLALRATGVRDAGAEMLAYELSSLSPAVPGAPLINIDGHNFDGSNNSGMVDAQLISSWADVGSLGATWSQGTAGNKFTYRASNGNGPAAQAPDTSRFMTSSSIAPINPPYTIALVWNTDKSGTNVIFDARGPFITQVYTLAGGTVHFSGGLSVDSGLNPSANHYHCLVIVVNDPSSEIRLDGVSTGLTNLGTSTLGAVFTIMRDTTTLGTVGFLKHFMVYGGSSVTPAQIETYLAARWGGSFPQ